MLVLLFSCTFSPQEEIWIPQSDPAPVQPIPIWPEENAPLAKFAANAPREMLPTTVFLMAGHANGRTRIGNIGVHGQIEAEVNLWTVEQLAERLEQLDRFTIVLGRTKDQRPSYGARIRHAERIGAHVFIELHTDARGWMEPWATTPDGWIYRSEGGTGFSVLYNEGGAVGPERRRLAQAVGTALSTAGFPSFPTYGNLYDNDEVSGVFIDRRGLMMLRRPTVPSIIIETHNAKHFDESLRWREERTLDAFASAIAEAIRIYRTPLDPEPAINTNPIRIASGL